jgi:hypothetical protein
VATPNMFPVVIEYVPLGADVTDSDVRREIEVMNGLPENSIQDAKWFKKVDRRRPEQMYGVAELKCTTAVVANKLIHDGASVRSRILNARKPQPEPTRCLKCQSFRGGHLARECKHEKDVCARCAGEHRTADCTKGPGELHCANCKQDGHGAADKRCRTYLDAVRMMMGRMPDLQFVYYPTGEMWTWDKVHGWEEPQNIVEFLPRRQEERPRDSGWQMVGPNGGGRPQTPRGRGLMRQATLNGAGGFTPARQQMTQNTLPPPGRTTPTGPRGAREEPETSV